MTLAMRQVIVDDANTRLKVAIETAGFPALLITQLDHQNIEKSTHNHMLLYRFLAKLTEPFYTAGFQVGLNRRRE